MIRRLLVTVMTLATVGAPFAAAAQDVRTEHVSYLGLDLKTSEGRDMLRRRVHGAMLRVCDPGMSDPMAANVLLRRCVAAAQPSVDAQLAAIGLAPPTAVRVLVAAR